MKVLLLSIVGLFLMASIGFGGEIIVKTTGSGSVDAVLTYTIENKEVTITGCNKDVAGDLVIPENIEGLPVLTIGGNAFKECKMLNLVVMSSKVEVVQDRAFAGCVKLRSVQMPDSVSEIQAGVFEVCTGLTNVNIPEGVESLNPWTFYSNSFESIILPESLEIIEGNSFRGCSRLSSITVPKGVKRIHQWAFLSCNKLNDIIFEGRAPETSEEAFWQKSELGSQRKVYAFVQPEHAESFGGVGADWKGLIVTLDKEKRGGQSEARLSMKEPSKPQAPTRPQGVGLTVSGGLAATGNEYLDGLMERTKLEWAEKRGSAIAEIDKKFIDKLKETKLSLIRANKISEARAYDNAIKGGDLSEQEPTSLVSLRSARAELIEKTTLPFNREYWEKLKEIREAFQENGNLKGIDVVDGEINRLIEDYSKAPEKVEQKTSLFDKPREEKVEEISLTTLKPISATVGNGTFRSFNMDNPTPESTDKIKVGDLICEDYLYAHAHSEIRYKIPDFARFFSCVGTGRGKTGSYKFVVKVDGEVLFESEQRHDYKDLLAPMIIEIPEGAKIIDLVVDGIETKHADWSVWANPMFRAKEPTEAQVRGLK